MTHSQRSILLIPILLGLFFIEVIAWKQFQQDAQASVAGKNMALLLHVAAALAAAIVGSLWLKKARIRTRLTLMLLFFIVGGVLPVGGVLIVAGIAWILASTAGDGMRAEDNFVFGNPSAIAARRESRTREIELRPLSEAMRTFGVPELESIIHGLRHLAPRRLVLHFLRRFQMDPQSNLQFAAQGVITANLEQLESQLRSIHERLAANPQDMESHLAAAEILLDLAAWTPDGDATAQVYREDALHHLAQVQQTEPKDERAWKLAASAHLGLEDPQAATTAISRLTASDPAQVLLMQAEFLAGNYARLADLSSRLEQPPSELHEVIGFWNGSIPTPAALLPKNA